MLVQIAFSLLLVLGDPSPIRIVDYQRPGEEVPEGGPTVETPVPAAPIPAADSDVKTQSEEVIGDPHCCHSCWPSPCWDWLFDHCNMPQHMAYFPTQHGYYYFRPYNYSHLSRQRDFVSSFGGDPRNPYDNKIFDQIYAKLREDEAAEAEKVPARGLPGPKKKTEQPRQ